MEKLIVVRPFNTATRRFAEGQEIAASDLAGDAMPFEERRKRFLAAPGESDKPRARRAR